MSTSPSSCSRDSVARRARRAPRPGLVWGGVVCAALLAACDEPPPPGPQGVAPAATAGVRESVERFEGEAGPGVEVPDGFPADLPLYPGARPTAQVASAQHGRMLMFDADDDPETVLSHFRSAWEREGWSFSHETDLDGETLVAFTKAGRRASVAVGATRRGSRITVATTPIGADADDQGGAPR